MRPGKTPSCFLTSPCGLAFVALCACSCRGAPPAEPDGGSVGADLKALVTSMSAAEIEGAAKRLARDLRPAVAEPPVSESQPVPLPAPPPKPAQPLVPVPVPAPETPPTHRPAPPPCNPWSICNQLPLEGTPVPVMQVASRAPPPRGGTPVAGVYVLTRATYYTGLFGAKGPIGFGRQSTIELASSQGRQIIAQEARLGEDCDDSSTVSLDLTGTKMTSAVVCSSTPCHDDCGGTLGYTAEAGPTPTLQLFYARGEVDSFTWRRPPGPAH
ncbi:MAG: hypothetical protein ACYDCL_18035 [Myxococcales bacterium]